MSAQQDWHAVTASTFADPADVAAYNHCRAKGHSELDCARAGDNGVGAWGACTARLDAPMVALPREVWASAGKTGGAAVEVRYKGMSVKAVLGDTMPRERFITNGAGIDLNPAACLALGVQPPALLHGVQWRWI